MLPWVLCSVLSGAVLLLTVKLTLLLRGLREVTQKLQEHLSSDTNTLITVSTNDSQIKQLAVNLNDQLRQLREERRRFQNGDRELNEAITNISHDLRTPLTAICGYLDLLEREDTSETVQGYLNQIENRTEALKSLTEELFRYSVIRTQEELRPRRLDLVRVLEEVLLSFYGVMQENGILPQLRFPDEPVWRELDSDALNRIFSNILLNAVKYSDGDLAVELTPDGTITFSNTAAGLTPVAVGRLFDRFYTVESGRSSTGLGLSIAKLLTERCGGRIFAAYENEILRITLQL